MTKHIGSIWTLHCGTPVELPWISNVTESRSCGVEGANVEFLLQHQNKCRLSITRGHCDRKIDCLRFLFVWIMITFIRCKSLFGIFLQANIEKHRKTAAENSGRPPWLPIPSLAVRAGYRGGPQVCSSILQVPQQNQFLLLLFRLLLWKALWRNRVCWNEWGEP